MTPYIYDGLDPRIVFWATVAATLLLVAFAIYETSRDFDGWDKKSWLGLGLVSLIWCIAFGFMVSTDMGNKEGLKEASAEARQLVEVDGLTIVNGEVNPTRNTVSNVEVSFPDSEENSSCNVYAPEDTSQAISVLCGSGSKGMTPESLAEWFKDGQPEDLTSYEVSEEESTRIVESVTSEETE